MNDLTLYELSTGSLISSPPPPRHIAMHMHPPRAFNTPIFTISNLRLNLYTILTMQRHLPRLFDGFLTSQQHASVSQGRIRTVNFTCCHTEIEVADETFCLTQSQYTDTGPTSPSADPIMPSAWQGSQWSGNFEVTGMTRPRQNSQSKRDSKTGSSALEVDALTTKPTRGSTHLMHSTLITTLCTVSNFYL